MSLLAMNNLYKNQVLAKQNLSSRKSHLCWHMQFLTPLHAISISKVGSVATGKVKTFTDMVLGLL